MEYADKTMIRNKIAFEFGKLVICLGYLHRILELFVNSEYQGTYNLVEKIEHSLNRINPEHSAYLLEIDQLERLDTTAPYFLSNFHLFHIKQPDAIQDSNELEHKEPDFKFRGCTYISKILG